MSEKIFDYHDDGGKKRLRNMDNKLPINTSSHLKELLYASTKLCKFDIIKINSCYSSTKFTVISNAHIQSRGNRLVAIFYICIKRTGWSQWPRVLRRGFAGVCSLGIRVRTPPGAWKCLL